MLSIPEFTFGRDKIFIYEPITSESVIRVVTAALQTHRINQNDINWLFNLYRGNDTRIIKRERAVDSVINYRAMVNMYSPIIDTKAGLLCQSPVTFVNRSKDEAIDEEIEAWGRIYKALNMQAKHKEMSTQVGICGLGYRFNELDEKYTPGVKNGHYPFKVSTLNPANTFSLWSDDADNESVAIVYMSYEAKPDAYPPTNTGMITGYSYKPELMTRFHVYTNDYTYEFLEDAKTPEVTDAMPWGIPIVEHYVNPYRIGFFERVQSLIYLRSILRSDQVIGVSEFINAIWFAVNIGIPEVIADPDSEPDEYRRQLAAQNAYISKIRRDRMLWVLDASKDGVPASLELKGMELNQTDTNVLDKMLRDDIIALAKIPNYAADLGASGNTGAAQTSSGWMPALIDTLDQEPYWFEGLQKDLKIQLEMCRYKGMDFKLTVEDIDLFIQRKTFDDKQSASQTFVQLRAAGIPISKAAEIANLVADTNNLEKQWKEFRDEEEARVTESTPTLTTEGEPTTRASTLDETRVVV
jgi:SPP1 family phage portal protein